MESYFYHRFRNFNLDTLLRVFDSGFILPRKMIVNGVDDANNIFNGNSYISLVQKTLMTDDMCRYFRSAYNELIQGNLCVVISSEIDGIVYPNYIDFGFDDSSVFNNKNDDSPYRYSYYMDEVQTAIPIPISKFIAIGYPIAHFTREKTKDEIVNDIITIKKKLNDKKINIPIIDSTNSEFADDEKQIELSKIKLLHR